VIPAPDRLAAQLRFVVEIDKLKGVLRRTYLTDNSRRENSAEHSWHLAMMAMLLHEYAAEAVELERVVKMLLVHDIVEIDAGDTFCYDDAGHVDKAEREQMAAQRLFRILPNDLADELHELWEEFETRDSADARFAAALDRLQPLLHNWSNDGGSWLEHGITRQQVIARTCHIEDGAPELWDYATSLIDEAVRRGFLDGKS
jgi:putative hydrolase of HD superfamily